jgi:hypothetical protein
MAKRRSAKQRVASRRNLIAARRKRNKRIAIGAGIVGTIGAATVLGVAGRSYVNHLRRPYRPSAFHPTHQLALPPGRNVTKVRTVKRPIPARKGAFKVNSSGEATYVRRPRGLYDAKRRAGLVPGYEKKIRSKYDGMSPRTQRRKRARRG